MTRRLLGNVFNYLLASSPKPIDPICCERKQKSPYIMLRPGSIQVFFPLTFCWSCLVTAESFWPLTPVVVSLQGRFRAAWRGRQGRPRAQEVAASRSSVSDLPPPNHMMTVIIQWISGCQHQCHCQKQKVKLTSTKVWLQLTKAVSCLEHCVIYYVELNGI